MALVVFGILEDMGGEVGLVNHFIKKKEKKKETKNVKRASKLSLTLREVGLKS